MARRYWRQYVCPKSTATCMPIFTTTNTFGISMIWMLARVRVFGKCSGQKGRDGKNGRPLIALLANSHSIPINIWWWIFLCVLCESKSWPITHKICWMRVPQFNNKNKKKTKQNCHPQHTQRQKHILNWRYLSFHVWFISLSLFLFVVLLLMCYDIHFICTEWLLITKWNFNHFVHTHFAVKN